MSPRQETGEVLATQTLGSYTVFTVAAPLLAAEFRPGHAVSIGTNGGLRRTVGLSSATAGDAFAGTIAFAVESVGSSNDSGIQWIAGSQPGAELDLIGPLGPGFPIPNEPVPAVLVGWRHSVATLIPLAAALLANGSPVRFVVSAPDAGGLFGELLVRRTVGGVTVVTDDGSAGEQATPAEAVAAAITGSGAQVIYAAGPSAQLGAIERVARANAVPAQALLDTQMPCATGICQGCLIPVRDHGRPAGLTRSCVEGPVFSIDRLDLAADPRPVLAGG